MMSSPSGWCGPGTGTRGSTTCRSLPANRGRKRSDRWREASPTHHRSQRGSAPPAPAVPSVGISIPPMNGIVAYGAYLPYFRLDRKAIGEALGSGGGKGTRVVASYDEDTTSMGAAGAPVGLRGAPRLAPAAVYFATAEPAYLDKTNATAIHAALALDESAMAFDMLGSIRSAAGALRAAMDAGRPTLAVLSDIRTGLPGGADERDGGDAAAAFLLGSGDAHTPVLAEPVAAAAVTPELLARWRVAGDAAPRQWGGRFGEPASV